MAERLIVNREVMGSIPVPDITFTAVTARQWQASQQLPASYQQVRAGPSWQPGARQLGQGSSAGCRQPRQDPLAASSSTRAASNSCQAKLVAGVQHSSRGGAASKKPGALEPHGVTSNSTDCE